MIVVDTSVWIDLLRGISSPLDEILGSGVELLHPFVFGELLLNGLPKSGPFADYLQGLKPAPIASPADEAAFIIWAKLAVPGIGYVDTHLLVSTKMFQDGKLLTRDKSLCSQAERLGLACVC